MKNTRNKITKKQINKAVMWWADQVAKPTFSAMGDDERKNPENRGMLFAESLASMTVKPVTEKQRKDFINALQTILEIENIFGRLWVLSVDYGPCAQLHYAAEIAGISQNNFPWKTTMWLMDGKVRVRVGYDGKEEEI